MFSWHDVRHSLRSLLKTPGFTALVLATLALGIGANTAVFTLVDAVLFKSLPVHEPAELYRLGDRNMCCVIGGLQNSHSLFSYPLYKYIQQQTPEFKELAGFQAGSTSITARLPGAADVGQPFSAKFVSGNYFTMFGVHAFAGRLLDAPDDRSGAPPVAVMSFRTWRDRFAANPAIVGGAMIFNGIPITIAGIADPAFFGDTLRPDPADFWIPLGAEPALRGKASLLADPSQSWLDAIGRLQANARPAQIQARLTSLLQQWLTERQDLGLHETSEKERIPQQHISLTPGGSGISILGSAYGAGLRMLSAISALVLIIACANIANLILSRVNPFQISVRAALGATRARLIGQTLSEGISLALAGGALGIAIAYGGSRAILQLAFRDAKYVPIEARPSLAVLAFALFVSLLTGILFSALPAWILSKTNPIDSLRGGSRFTTDHAAMPRHAMVIVQATLSFVMLAAAGLLTVSLWRLEHQSFGFQTDGRLIVSVNPSLTEYTDDRLVSLYRQLDERLNSLPGVQSASFSLYSPMSGDNWQGGVSVEGRTIDLRNDSASWDRVSPHYFETVGTRLIEGRTIDERDTAGSTHVAVVNEAFVHKYFPSANVLGKHFGLGDQTHTGDFEIVGVVANAKYSQADRDVWPFFFVPYFQSGHYDQAGDVSVMRRSNYVQNIELRFTGRAENVERTVRDTLAKIDTNLTVMNVVSFEDQLSANFNRERLIARLTTLYGVIALLLAGIGLYGVAAYGVKKRTPEIGIRMALGASRDRVIGMVFRATLLQITFGLAIGIPAALVAGQLLSAKLYGVTGHDIFVLSGSAFVIFIAALLAAIIPARRAASIDPIKALRIE